MGSANDLSLDARRRFFAEEIEAVARLRSPALVDALAHVPREQFLPEGPWTTLADMDMSGSARHVVTPDADPKRVYHNIGIAIDPARQLFNGQPATLATWIDALGVTPGARVLHIGAGLGYYTAVMAHAAGASGRVVAFEVDEALASAATRNLAPYPWVEVRHGDAATGVDGPIDAMLINAGVTHPLDLWLDALSVGGRMMAPMTSAMPAMGATIGKGLSWLITKTTASDFSARVVGLVAVYSALGVRDEQLSARLGKAMMLGPQKWQAVTRVRRDAHEESDACWMHASGFCLSA